VEDRAYVESPRFHGTIGFGFGASF
jgi:hypothetical protein